eukprot:1193520-Rhodomonas_salina.1
MTFSATRSDPSWTPLADCTRSLSSAYLGRRAEALSDRVLIPKRAMSVLMLGGACASKRSDELEWARL